MGLDAIGDWMTSVDDNINNFIADHNSSYATWLASDRAAHADPQTTPSGATGEITSDLGGFDALVRSVPGGGFVLDFGNRTADTLMNTAAYADHVYDTNPSAGYSAMFDKDVWAQAWDSWGTPGHVTAGSILANDLTNPSSDPRLHANPFDAQGAQAIQAGANENWYGTAVAGATDLAAGFILPIPGAGPLKAARAANTIKSAAEADRVFEAARTASAAEGGLSGMAGRSSRLDPFVRPNNPNTQLSRMVESINKTNGITSQSEMMAHLSPLMEHAGESFKALAADVFVKANALGPELATQAKVNTLLAASGSRGARAALIEDSPLVARTLENFMSGPRYAHMSAAIADARASGAEYDLGSIIDNVYGLAGDKAEIGILKKQLADHKATWQSLRDAQAKVAEAQPKMRTKGPDGAFVDQFDVARLKESRVMAATNVQQVTKELAQAKADLKGNGRWSDAAAKTGDPRAIADFNVGRGAALQRVDDLSAKLSQARDDHALFQQTPLHNVDDLAAWQSALDGAKSAKADASMTTRWTEAEMRTRRLALNAKKAEIGAGMTGFQSANDWLSQLHSIGDTVDLSLGNFRVSPSRLDALKTQARLSEMGEVTIDAGGWLPKIRGMLVPHPGAAWKAVGTPRARGGINLTEIDKGVREFNASLQRSGVYADAEIVALRDKLIATAPGAGRVKVVKDAETEMLTRMAEKHYADRFPNMPREELLKQAQSDTRQAIVQYGKGRAYLMGRSQEAELANDPMVMFRDDEGNLVAHDAPTLRSHLADTAPFIDPGVFKSQLAASESAFRRGLKTTHGGLDMANTLWKHGALLRPGLGFRAMLDEGLRGTALIGAASQMAGAVNGTLKIASNLPALSRLTGGNLEKIAFKLEHPTYNIGGGEKFTANLHEDAATAAAIRMGLTKGGSTSGNLIGATRNIENKLAADFSKWQKYKADSHEWVKAYGEQAKVMLASPTVRKMLDDQAAGPLGVENIDDYTRELFKHPEIRAEYDALARRGGVKDAKLGMTRGDYVRQVMGDTMTMFPNADVATAVRNGTLSKGGKRTERWITENFPPERRFDVPGPQSILRPDSISGRVNGALGKFYENVLDKPNYWMVRHPVYQTLYKRGLKHEIGAMLLKRKAEGVDSLSIDDLAAADRRAKLNASTTVRNTFYDNTRNTDIGEHLRLISPFFNAWQDAAMSWSRLVYDDPKRLARMAGAWNGFENLSQHGLGPLTVDQDGNPVKPGQHPDGGTYLVVPVKVPSISLPGIGQVGGGVQLRVRKDALNSIAQGEVPWLPGFGPVATVATTELLTRVLPKDVLYAFSTTDAPVISSLRNSMFLSGEVPSGDAGATWGSLLPPTMRNALGDIWGTNYGANVAYNLNQQYIDSLRTGMRPDPQAALAEAERQAHSAGVVRAISAGLFGMSGRAVVQGQFYVDQMHTLLSVSPSQLRAAGARTPEELFTKMHPEAAGLKWHITANETGIQATVDAELAADKYKTLIDAYPERGWFILGQDNLIDNLDPNKTFSGTAYNQQTTERYGVLEKGRKREDPAQAINDSLIQQGWKDYSSYMDQLTTLDQQMGGNKKALAAVKSAVVDYIAGKNRSWYQDYSSPAGSTVDAFFADADKLAEDPSLGKRPDMQLYRDYRESRQQILDAFGIKSFTGKSAQTEAAKMALADLGDAASKNSLVFQQMWDRVLSKEAR